jgi:hypothetical protein
VPRRSVFGARVTEPDDQLDHVQSWRLIEQKRRLKHRPHRKNG